MDLEQVICCKPSRVFEVQVSKMLNADVLCSWLCTCWVMISAFAGQSLQPLKVVLIQGFVTMIPIGQLYLSAIFVSLMINVQIVQNSSPVA